jgi:YVTN family beta-propeller protein
VSTGASEPGRVPGPKVFITYRREETSAQAGRLYDAMVGRFGENNVFMDVDMAPGVDFVERIAEAVAACHVLIVVMGPHWATVEDERGRRRLADPEDFVRLEVETALRRPDVTPIPVLVAGGRMPSREDLPEEVRAITRRNALELSDMRWRQDVGRLISTLDELLANLAVAPPITPEGNLAVAPPVTPAGHGRERVAGDGAGEAAMQPAPAPNGAPAPPGEAEAPAPPAPGPSRRPARSRRRWWALAGLAVAAVIGIAVALLVGGGSGGGTTSGGGGATSGTTSFGVGGEPVGIAVAANGIWVSNRDDNTVTHLRPDGRRAHPDIPVGTTPSGLVVHYGKVWVANARDNSVTPITGNSPGDPITGDGTTFDDPRAIGAGRGSVWVTNTGSNTVAQLDRDGNPEREITVGNGPRGIVVGAGGVWVSNGDDDTVSEIPPGSPTANAPIRLGPDTKPKGLAIAHGKVWVADEGTNTVTPIDIKDRKAGDPIPVGATPRDVASSNFTDKLYVTNGGADSVSVIDPVSGQVIPSSKIVLPPGSGPEDVSAGLDKVWVAAGDSNQVIRLNP